MHTTRRKLGWISWWLTLAVLVALVAVGIPWVATSQEWLRDGGSDRPDAAALARLSAERSGEGLVDLARHNDVLRADASCLVEAVAGVSGRPEGRYSIAVANLEDDSLAVDEDAHATLVPASTMKLVTAVAALSAIGPDATFKTAVVASGDALTIVGAGDPLLAADTTSYEHHDEIDVATTEELAKRTAEALRKAGTDSVTLSYDDTRFTGEAWHRDWHTEDRVFVAPVAALSVDEGEGVEGTEPLAPAAAQRFAAQLSEAGIEVRGEPSAAVAPVEAQPIAEVASPRLEAIVRQMLVHSDNVIAEVLARQVAQARGAETSFRGATAEIRAILGDAEFPIEELMNVDGSGMSENNRLSADLLVAILQRSLTDERLGVLSELLPVAHVSGTLANRYWADAAEDGRGVVRAKTGTLNKVSTLAGYAPTEDGAVLVFAMMSNDIEQDAQPWIDELASTLAGSSCVPS